MSLPKLNDDNDNIKKKPSLPVFDMPDIEDEDDDVFEDVLVEEVLNEEDSESNRNIYEELENIDENDRIPLVDSQEKISEIDKTEDYNPDYEDDIEEGKKKKFINKKEKKIIPFGGKKSKRKIKSSEFDSRKNTLSKTKIIRTVIMAIIVIMFLLGLKNTFFPSHVYTDEQIRQFAAEGAGQTGFPEERGKAFVENFMEAYLTFDRSKPELTEALSYYYGELASSSLSSEKTNRDIGISAKQQVLIKPNVYESNLLTEYSAQFKVNTYVSNSDGTGDTSSGRWLSFVINVYYDKKMDTLTITKDSPSIIPSYRIATQDVLEERAPFGNGEINSEIAPAINPTINGFIEAYAKSSIESHEAILQYIDNKEDITLFDGFGGALKLKGDPATSIQKIIYNHEDGIYRIDLTVLWVDAQLSEDNEVTYTSKYQMRVKSIGEGKYAVSSFSPYTYYIE